MSSFSIRGKVVDVHNRRIYAAEVQVSNGRIAAIHELEEAPQQYLLPGFVDAHIHIESSMLTPAAFGQAAVVHGTVATVSDPHEIANVCGAEGVQYMIDNARLTPLKICYGAPSCVPATTFETAGATLDAAAVEQLLQSPDIYYLSEMMNYPGVLHGDAEVMAKIAAAHKAGKPVDGHAPGLIGADAATYAAAGITTDHECFTLEEALHKITCGMKILIREGSAARNYEALCDLLRTHPEHVMFCSDDKHPDELALHHINDLVRRSVAKGYDVFDVLRAASVHPVEHYGLPVGLLRTGDAADFIVVEDLENFGILQTYIDGQLVAEKGHSLLAYTPPAPINNFSAEPRQPAELALKANGNSPVIRVIEAMEGQLITNLLEVPAKVEEGLIVSDTANDVLKMVVINRYQPKAPIATGFIRNIGLQKGALASTVAHDCHNIIAVGADDESICAAINALVACEGGIAVAESQASVETLPLPVAGLMSTGTCHEVGAAYTRLTQKARDLGSSLHAPFMTLSFMALLVIPSLKLSDKGLFDGSAFRFTGVEKE